MALLRENADAWNQDVVKNVLLMANQHENRNFLPLLDSILTKVEQNHSLLTNDISGLICVNLLNNILFWERRLRKSLLKNTELDFIAYSNEVDKNLHELLQPLELRLKMTLNATFDSIQTDIVQRDAFLPYLSPLLIALAKLNSNNTFSNTFNHIERIYGDIIPFEMYPAYLFGLSTKSDNASMAMEKFLTRIVKGILDLNANISCAFALLRGYSRQSNSESVRKLISMLGHVEHNESSVVIALVYNILEAMIMIKLPPKDVEVKLRHFYKTYPQIAEYWEIPCELVIRAWIGENEVGKAELFLNSSLRHFEKTGIRQSTCHALVAAVYIRQQKFEDAWRVCLNFLDFQKAENGTLSNVKLNLEIGEWFSVKNNSINQLDFFQVNADLNCMKERNSLLEMMVESVDANTPFRYFVELVRRKLGINTTTYSLMIKAAGKYDKQDWLNAIFAKIGMDSTFDAFTLHKEPLSITENGEYMENELNLSLETMKACASLESHVNDFRALAAFDALLLSSFGPSNEEINAYFIFCSKREYIERAYSLWIDLKNNHIMRTNNPNSENEINIQKEPGPWDDLKSPLPELLIENVEHMIQCLANLNYIDEAVRVMCEDVCAVKLDVRARTVQIVAEILQKSNRDDLIQVVGRYLEKLGYTDLVHVFRSCLNRNNSNNTKV